MIKKWKKRILGFLLCAVLAASLIIPAMALEVTPAESVEETEPEPEPEPEEASLVVTPEEVTLHVIGQTQQLHAEMNISEIDDTEVTWTVNDDKVATVDGNGLVTAVGEGEATVTASVTYEGEEYSASCSVTVDLHSDGIYQNPDDGDWYYYIDGEIAVDKTDVIQDTVGTIGAKGDWWNVVNGKVTPGETVAKNSKGWWYINAEGMVDFDYTGFAKNANGSWYCENGKVTFTANSVLQDKEGKIGEEGTWWYVVGSEVQTGFTGLADYRNSSGWWYIEDGKVTFTANTLAKNKNGWYYVKDSKVDFDYTGFAENDNGKWYVQKGTVTFKNNSVYQDTGGVIGEAGTWWYVVGSKVQTGFTGLANYRNASGWWYIENGKVTFNASTVAKNSNGWFYVRNSKVDFDYTGFAENGNGKWYVQNGKVAFKKNGVIQDATGAIGDKGAWWYVTGSKVQTGYTGLANYSNANGWWYIKNGQVDFTHNGVDKNKNGWYYVTGGKVQFGFTGLANYKNANGWWYIKNGKVDFSHSGLARNKNGWYYLTNGKVDFSFNGIASNSGGMWLVQNGKVNFDYNGSYTYSGVPYTVTNGKATVSLNGMSTSMYNKAQSQSSSTKWLIMVDVDNCKLGVLQGSNGNWVPTKYWTCSTGAAATPTVRGTYSLTSKGKSFGDGFTCWYYNQFYGNYLIHSILYNQGSMTSVQDGRLGEHVSHGCVRLSLENAKWIYDNVPIGTRVVTY